jgi:N-acetyl-anhydromuramyl-L-alanine amidase AmpD/GH24 family phage-related lysozyme (muramidase)
MGKHAIVISIIIVFLLAGMTISVLAFGYIKSHLEWACNFKTGMNMVFGEPFTEATCKNVGSSSGGANYVCSGDDLDMISLGKQLEKSEGRRTNPYTDTKGKWTIGIGHLLSANANNLRIVTGNGPDYYTGHPERAITEKNIDDLFALDIIGYTIPTSTTFSNWTELPSMAKQVLVEMAYQGGPGIFKQSYPTLITAIENQNFQEAAAIMRDPGSLLVRTSKTRALDEADRMEGAVNSASCQVGVIPSGDGKGSGVIKDYAGRIPTNNNAELNFDTALGNALLAAIKDGEQQNPPIKIVVYSGSSASRTGHSPNSRHYRGLAADINTTAGPTCFKGVSRGGCKKEVVAIMNKYGLFNPGLCHKGGAGFDDGDCNHFQLSAGYEPPATAGTTGTSSTQAGKTCKVADPSCYPDAIIDLKSPDLSSRADDGNNPKNTGYIVLHHTATETKASAINAWVSAKNTNGTQAPAGCHYLVNTDGKVYSVYSENQKPECSGSTGEEFRRQDFKGFDIAARSIGIEIVNCGINCNKLSDTPPTPSSNICSDPYTPDQISALKGLIAYLETKYSIPASHVVGHSAISTRKMTCEPCGLKNKGINVRTCSSSCTDIRTTVDGKETLGKCTQ